MGKTTKRLLAILFIFTLLTTAILLTACAEEEVNIDHIEIYSSPKTEYYLGESLDLTDARIKVVYKNNQESLEDVTPSMISDFDPYTLGAQYIKIYYNGHSATINVTVKRYGVKGVELVIPEENYDYIEEQNLRLNDSYLILKYVNGDSDRIAITPQMCSGFDPYTLGQQTITVSYQQDGKTYTAVYNITVTEKKLIGVEVSAKPAQTVYYLGDTELDLTGGELFLKYDNDYSVRMPMCGLDGVAAGLTIEWDNSVVNSDAVVTVSYGGFSSGFTINVQNRNVATYSVYGVISTQMQNLPISLAGAAADVLYTNGESETIALDDSDRIRIEGYDSTVPGEKTVQLVFIYGGVELAYRGSLSVYVEERRAVSLEIVDAPVVYQATPFDLNDWTYRLIYSNGEYGDPIVMSSSLIVWENNLEISAYDDAGSKSWYIRYDEGVAIDYEFEVVALRVTNIDFNNAEDVIAHYSGDIVADGVTMTVTYNSGTVRENVPLDPASVIFDNMREGNQSVTVVYKDEYESEGYLSYKLSVLVVRKIESLTIRIPEGFKSVYHVGEEFSAGGLVFDIVYDYGDANASASITVPDNDVFDDDFYDNWSFADNLEEGGSLLFSIVGEHKIRIINAGFVSGLNPEITVQVTNNFKELKGLYRFRDGEYVEVDTSVACLSVVQGNNLDMSDYYLLVAYEGNERFVSVKDEAVLDYNPRNTMVGNRNVTIYIGDDNVISQGFIINVVTKSVIGITIAHMPDKLIYVAGNSTSALDLQGIVVRVVYDNGTFDKVDESELSQAGFEYTEAGEQTITIGCYVDGISYSAEFTINVLNAAPTSIEWLNGGTPEAEITKGTDFDFDNIYIQGESGYMTALANKQVSIYYNDNNRDVVMLGDIAEFFTVTGYQKTSLGTQHIMLNYLNGTYLRMNANVVARRLDSIELRNSDDSTVFEVIQGAPIDLNKLKLVLIFDDGSESIAPVASENINYNALDNPNGYNVSDLSVGAREVTVTYLYGNESIAKSTVVSFNVREKSLVSIEIFDIPKQKYIELEPLDLTGGSIMAYYDNGTTEIHLLTEASLNISDASFNIDTSNFDNSEFTDKTSKKQRIIINFAFSDGVHKSAGFNIYMRDRHNVVAKFAADNDYNITYGDSASISVALYGYETYDSNGATTKFENTRYTVEYIPDSVWTTVGRLDGVDYSDIPKLAGSYRIVVSYEGDSIHNVYVNSDNLLVIDKKPVSIGIKAGTMIYGTAVPAIYVIGPAFVNDDDFYSANFNSDISSEYSDVIVDELGIYLNMFDVVYTDGEGNVIEITDRTAAGRYSLRFRSEISSPNYAITYGAADFIITQRAVNITPYSNSYIYGFRPPVIRYDVGQVDGDVNSGVVDGDILQGGLSRERISDDSVGTYRVTLGTLGINKNYSFNLLGSATVTILRRYIYIKAESVIRIYGEEWVAPAIKFYGDASCESESSAFAQGDNASSIGVFELDTEFDAYTNVGQYVIGARLVSEGDKIGNYNLNYVSGSVEVAPRPLVVTAVSAYKYYGEQDPVISYTVSAIEGNPASGLIIGKNGTLDVLPGNLARVEGDDVGLYNITVGDLGKDSSDTVSNYEISLSTATFIIKPRELYFAFDQELLGKVYDGKAPSIDSNAITKVYYKNSDGHVIPIGNSVDALLTEAQIGFLFDNASKDSGEYKIRVTSYSANNVAYFYNDVDYRYTITKAPIRITREDYVNLPDGKEYCGIAFTLSARVPDEYLLPVYNVDGTPATDANNDPLKDNVQLVLSVVSVMDAGTYKVRVLNVLNQNYTIADEDNEEVTFSIVPKNIYIEINCNSSTDPDTREYEFDNQIAYILNEYYVLKDSDGATVDIASVPQFSLGITIPGKDGNGNDVQTEVEAYSVRYSDDGELIAYDISIVDKPADANYNIVLRKHYKFKIVPKTVTLSIYDNYLSKSYDGFAPSIADSMFTLSEIGLVQKDVNFYFTRESNDGRDNASVGEYAISIDCNDHNYIVKLAANYMYRITSTEVSVTIRSQALAKTYDGKDYALTYSDLNMTSYLGTAPIIRNFVNQDAYEAFLEILEELDTKLTGLRTTYGYVDFTQPAAAAGVLVSIRDSANDLRAKIEDCKNIFSEANYTTLHASVIEVASYADSAYKRLTTGNDATAAEDLYISAGKSLAQIASVYSNESAFIAFVFNANSTADVGNYSFVSYDHDYNRSFNIASYSGVTVNKRTLRVNVENVSIMYGKTADDPIIPYVIVDNGVPISEDELMRLNIINKPTTTANKNSEVGKYSVDVRGMYIALLGSTTMNSNYELLPGVVGEYRITRAKISVVLEDVDENYNCVYGNEFTKGILTRIYGVDFKYIDPAVITDANTELGQLADMYGVGETIREKAYDYFGSLCLDDDTSVISAKGINYYCYLNGISGEEVFNNAKVPAGEYILNASGFTAANYSINVIPAKLIVHKATLSVFVGTNGYIAKTYGDDSVSFVYQGFAPDDSATEILVKPEGDDKGIRLSEMVWNYDLVDSSLDDPFSKGTHVSNTSIAVRLSSDGYVLDNYKMNFSQEIPIRVVKATLTLTPRSTTGVMITAPYRGVPLPNSYAFDYDNLRNDEKAEDHKINVGEDNAPVLITRKSDNSYYEAGRHQFGINDLDLTKTIAALTDYDLVVSTFDYNVTKLPIKVTVTVPVNAQYCYDATTRENDYSLSAYVVKVTYDLTTKIENGETVKVKTPTSASIISGNYGLSAIELDFTFSGIPSGNEVAGLTTAEIEDLKSKISKFSSDTGVIYDDDTSMRTEIYDYENMYAHKVNKTKYSQGSKTVLCSLMDMSISDNNYSFEYTPFIVNIYTVLGGLNIVMPDKLLSSDDSEKDNLGDFVGLTDDAQRLDKIKELINVEALHTGGILALDNGQYTLSGTVPTVPDVTAALTAIYDDNYVLFSELTGLKYKYVSNNQEKELSVSDSRTLSCDQHVEKTIPIRFYSTSTKSYDGSTLDIRNDGASYQIGSVDQPVGGETYLANIKRNYNRGAVEFRAIPVASRELTNVRIVIGGDYSGQYLFIEFAYGDYNVLKIGYSGGYYGYYELNYGTVFDGESHEVKFIIDSGSIGRYLNILISVDGNVGALYDLHSLSKIVGNDVQYAFATNATLPATSDFGVFARASEFAIRRIECASQGIYDSTGTFISLKENGSTVLYSSNNHEYATVTSDLSKFFGLPQELPSGYSVEYFLDGSVHPLAYGETISIKRGSHRVEAVLRYDGALIDYECITLIVDKVPAYNNINFYSSLDDVNTGVQYYAGMSYDMYNSANYNGSVAIGDKTLVRDSSDDGTNKQLFIMSSKNASIYEPKYLSTSFDIIRSAIEKDGGIYYSGNSLVSYNVFGNGEASRYVYIDFVIEQNGDESVVSPTYNYNITVQVRYKLGSYENTRELAKVAYSGSANIPTYAITAYIDRNAAINGYGSNNLVVSVTLLGVDTQSVILKDSENNSGLYVVNMITAIRAPRLIFHNFVSEERGMGKTHDYLVTSGGNTTWLAADSNGSAIAGNSTVSLNSGYNTPAAFIMDNQTWVYSYGDATSGTLNFRFNESTWDNSLSTSETGALYRGAYLRYDIESAKFYFGFKYYNITLLEQVWQTSSSSSGKHVLNISVDCSHSTLRYIDYNSDNALQYGSVTVAAKPAEGSRLYYQVVTVTYDNESQEFYCPLFGDINLWKLSDGETYGYSDSNPYGSANINLKTAPTFLSMYAYTRLETSVDMTLYGVSFAYGEDKSFADSAVTEIPKI